MSHPGTVTAVWIAVVALTAAVSAASCSGDEASELPGTGGTGTGATGGTGAGGGTAGGAHGGGGTGGAGAGGSVPACPDPAPAEATSPVVYVCDCAAGADADCQPGDDAADGLSAASPLQSYAMVRQAFGALAPGGMVALCRGGSFTVDAAAPRFVNASCTAAAPCVVRDYDAPWASGDEPAPRITAPPGFNAVNLEDGGNADHEEGYVFLHLDLRGSGDGWGVFVYNDADDVLLCDLSLSDFAIGVHVGGSNPPAAGSDGANQRIVLRSSRVTDNAEQGWLGSCDGCAVEGSYFENNGFADAVFDHNIYFSGDGDDMRAVGNTLYRSAQIGGSCQGVSLVVHGNHQGMLLEGNEVREDVGAASPGCWGIAVDTGYGSPEAFGAVTIRGNRVLNVGNVGIGLNACVGCVVENNVVVSEQPFGATGIAIPDRDRAPDDGALDGVIVRNNSLYFGPGTQGTGIALGGEGSGHVAVSNAVRYAGSSGGFRCFDYDLAAAAYDDVDYNVCGYAAGAWEPAGDLAAFQAATSLDAHSNAADPAYTSTVAPVYDLAPASAASPLVDAGHPTASAPLDITGKARDQAPDVGAYEL